jgi:hypothetical protein
MRIGCLLRSLGGVSVNDVVAALTSGAIMIPHMAAVPSFVALNADQPPELEVRFELEREGDRPEEWNNWQLQFVHNQLFSYFKVPTIQIRHLNIVLISMSHRPICASPTSAVVPCPILSRAFPHDLCAQGKRLWFITLSAV